MMKYTQIYYLLLACITFNPRVSLNASQCKLFLHQFRNSHCLIGERTLHRTTGRPFSILACLKRIPAPLFSKPFVPFTVFTSLVNGVMNPSITSTGSLADSLNLSLFFTGHLISFKSFAWFLRGASGRSLPFPAASG